MRRAITILGLAFGLAGCGSVPAPHDSSPAGAMANMDHDTGAGFGSDWTCPPEVWITGVIVPDKFGSAAIRDDQGRVHRLMWGIHNPSYVDWDQLYKIGGWWFDSPGDILWACGGAASVIRL